MESKEHIVLLVIGRTCAGKTTLVKKLCERTNLVQLKSFTTRSQRNADDTDHTFINIDFYQEQKELGHIIAETCIAGNYYFCTIDQLYQSDVYTIDKAGLEMLQSANLPNIRFVVVYIMADAKIREYRALKVRRDDKIVFRKREISENSSFRELERDLMYDYAISNNGDISRPYSVLRWISQIEGVWKNHMEVDEE